MKNRRFFNNLQQPIKYQFKYHKFKSFQCCLYGILHVLTSPCYLALNNIHLLTIFLFSFHLILHTMAGLTRLLTKLLLYTLSFLHTFVQVALRLKSSSCIHPIHSLNILGHLLCTQFQALEYRNEKDKIHVITEFLFVGREIINYCRQWFLP